MGVLPLVPGSHLVVHTRLIVPGEPETKERPRFTRTGRAYTTNKTAAKEAEIGQLWSYSRIGRVPDGTQFAIRVVARFAVPKSHKNVKGEVRECKFSALPGPKKDIDNVLKLVLDALNSVAYVDDRYCIAAIVTKQWCPAHQLVGETEINITWTDPTE